MATTFAMALRRCTAHSRLLVRRWLATWMLLPTAIQSRRVTTVESFLAVPSMRTTRAIRLRSEHRLGYPRSKARACHCEGLSHMARIFPDGYYFLACLPCFGTSIVCCAGSFKGLDERRISSALQI